MAKTLNVPTVKVQLRLGEDVFDAYAERAAKSGNDPEAEMLKTLSRCRSHNDVSPIYLNDTERNELSQLAGHLLRTPDEVLSWGRSLTSLHVAGVDIPLSTNLLTRLRTRCFGATKWDEFIQRIITEALEQYVGLR